MSGEKKKPALTPKAEAAKQEREARLALALRENLRKRKAQERARPVTGSKPGDEPSGT
jgi:hypothetical protein